MRPLRHFRRVWEATPSTRAGRALQIAARAAISRSTECAQGRWRGSCSGREAVDAPWTRRESKSPCANVSASRHFARQDPEERAAARDAAELIGLEER